MPLVRSNANSAASHAEVLQPDAAVDGGLDAAGFVSDPRWQRIGSAEGEHTTEALDQVSGRNWGGTSVATLPHPCFHTGQKRRPVNRRSMTAGARLRQTFGRLQVW